LARSISVFPARAASSRSRQALGLPMPDPGAILGRKSRHPVGVGLDHARSCVSLQARASSE
jgi:hypothetical protein